MLHPWNSNMEPENEPLENKIPFRNQDLGIPFPYDFGGGTFLSVTFHFRPFIFGSSSLSSMPQAASLAPATLSR